MALTSFSSGVNTSFSTELNDNFKAVGGTSVSYTGAGFDVSVSGNSQNTSASYEFAAISSADLGDADYLDISVYIEKRATATGSGDAGSVYLKIETKDDGGSYSDSLAEQIVHSASDTGGITVNTDTTVWRHTLTASEKSAGVVVKITGRCTTSSSGDSASITNVQTTIKTGV